MYDINLDKYFRFADWSCIYWGIKEGLTDPRIAIEFADKTVEQNPDSDIPEIIELLIVDYPEKEVILSLIENMFSDKEELKTGKAIAMRRLRFILLREIQESMTDNQIQSDEIERIYADFGYPSDMEDFISYMPVCDDGYDTLAHSQMENEQRLINKFNIFMKDELSKL